MIRREAEYFFGALRYFTRLPVPAWVGHSPEKLNGAARYFPLVGVLVGAAGGLAFELAAFLFPITVAVLFGMAATVLLTGGFHEDGFADAVDGFGGGWDKARVLAIMKDSRLGSYGAIGITLLLLAKFVALLELPDDWIAVSLIAAHAASRFCAVTLIAGLPYVREDETSRAKPLASALGPGALAVASLFGLAPLLLLPWEAAAAALILAAAVTGLAARYFRRRIGGYTGDCLGAVQQAAELAVYLALLAAAWNFS